MRLRRLEKFILEPSTKREEKLLLDMLGKHVLLTEDAPEATQQLLSDHSRSMVDGVR